MAVDALKANTVISTSSTVSWTGDAGRSCIGQTEKLRAGELACCFVFKDLHKFGNSITAFRTAAVHRIGIVLFAERGFPFAGSDYDASAMPIYCDAELVFFRRAGFLANSFV